jgi:hypothetical protein
MYLTTVVRSDNILGLTKTTWLSVKFLVHWVHNNTGQYSGLECSVSSKYTPWGLSYIIGIGSHYGQNYGQKRKHLPIAARQIFTIQKRYFAQTLWILMRPVLYAINICLQNR